MKIIFLILYGHDDRVTYHDRFIYQELQRLSQIYFKKMSETFDFKYFFISYNNDIDKNIVEQDDCIFIKGNEEFNKIYEKTQLAMKYVHTVYNADYIVRTNISSFWNIPNLFSIIDRIPREKCFAGVKVFDFISGTGLIFSRDACEYFIHQPICYGPDDVNISYAMSKYCHHSYLDESYMYYMTDDRITIPNNTDSILYYRIKNGNRLNDILCFKTLLSHIYLILEDIQR